MGTVKFDATTLRERLDAGLARMGLVLDDRQRGRLIALLALLERWNRTFNLTAVRDPWEMVPRHLLDSLSANEYLYGDTILDVGTGAGFPGLPLAVAAPRREFFLLDSNGKKVRFVRQAALELKLANVRTIQARVESYIPERKFATIVSRAVTSLPELLAATRHLIDRPGRLLAMRGRQAQEELGGLDPPPDAVLVHPVAVPFLDGDRHLIEIRYD